ncbi:hypothetical protein SEA_JUANYO_7 [Microbacterium phage Juanyo]|nr:hypothetical protein SEA_JUANYO_7 [Microbacterium phage Juanyo]
MSTSTEWREQRKARKAEAAEVMKANAEEAKAKLKAYREAARTGVPLVEEPVVEDEEQGTEVVTQDGHTEDQGTGTPPDGQESEDE